MKYDLLIKNIRRYDFTAGTPVFCSVGVSDGRIAAFLPRDDETAESDNIIDGRGKHIIPGLIDLHVHFRDPGFTYKEDIISGSECAAAGGVTSVFCMPNTNPVCDNSEVTAYILDRSKSAKCRVFPVAAITKGLGTAEVCDIVSLAKAGACAFSDDGKPVISAAVLRQAMKIAAENDLLIMSHCEDISLAGGAINEGSISRMLGVSGTPNLCEDIATMRDIAVAEETGCRLHICHVSTRGALEAIRAAKARGVKVTAETCPHYFSLSDEDVVFYGAMAKMNPPLRSKDDVAAVIEAIRDGTIDCISTDHAPHSDAEKAAGIEKAPNGIIGLQTSFAVSYTNLVVAGHITLPRLIELMSVNPAKITRLHEQGLGSLEVGNPADFAIVSLGVDNTIAKSSLKGKSANTPFAGMTFNARVDATYVSGKCVYQL
jgi:dihydroorotase